MGSWLVFECAQRAPWPLSWPPPPKRATTVSPQDEYALSELHLQTTRTCLANFPSPCRSPLPRTIFLPPRARQTSRVGYPQTVKRALSASLIPSTPPAAPTGVSGVIAAQVNLTWTAVSGAAEKQVSPDVVPLKEEDAYPALPSTKAHKPWSDGGSLRGPTSQRSHLGACSFALTSEGVLERRVPTRPALRFQAFDKSGTNSCSRYARRDATGLPFLGYSIPRQRVSRHRFRVLFDSAERYWPRPICYQKLFYPHDLFVELLAP